ncbi:MAG: tetratricopeptide repeat-containing protein [Candidatus Thiosymbion ectosymbiont of Robbea hypermnestra]|nr:tetratricopeptide repeat-containing protein [Candidatus Thiosymbion ectosymbiont of Robbea hypermnestra]
MMKDNFMIACFLLLLPTLMFMGCSTEPVGSVGSGVPGIEEKLRILRDWEDSGRPPPHDVITDLNRVTVKLFQAGKLEEADAYAHRLVDLTRRDLGRNHPDTLHAMNNIGVVYYLEKRYSEVEPIFEEVLRTRKRVLGKHHHHPDTILSAENLAELYRKQGRKDKADRLVRAIRGE